MTDTPPTPPEKLEDGFTDTLENHSPETLRRLAQYLEALAEYREGDGRPREATSENESEGAPEAANEQQVNEPPEGQNELPEERPEGVPAKATLTVKEIHDNRYYYWQWREGDTVTSKYKGPVDGEK